MNDLLLSCDSGSLSILLLLDLSSAFDTVSHDLLISRLSGLGISGTALFDFLPISQIDNFIFLLRIFNRPPSH